MSIPMTTETYTGKCHMTRIPAHDLPRMVGKLMHVAGDKTGCVYRLVSIDGD